MAPIWTGDFGSNLFRIDIDYTALAHGHPFTRYTWLCFTSTNKVAEDGSPYPDYVGWNHENHTVAENKEFYRCLDMVCKVVLTMNTGMYAGIEPGVFCKGILG